MAGSKENLSVSELRRRRINLYKKIIIAVIIFFILLPTVFCVILFVRVGQMEEKLNTLMMTIYVEDDISQIKLTNPQYVYANETESEAAIEETESVSVTEAAVESEIEETTAESVETAETTTAEKETTEEETDYETLVQEALEAGRKVVYLTFDDGPSHNTNCILDILAEYNVKATFFTIGRTEEEYVDEYQRIVEEGHSLGMHSFSHKYKEIYASVEAFDADFRKISTFIEDITGLKSLLYRFPGGSSNLVSGIPMTNFIRYLNDKGVTYFDWNVSAQDAEGKELPIDAIVDNVFKDIDKKDECVVLMHDADNLNTTVKALTVIIERLQEMDALILPITDTTTRIQHIDSTSVQ